MANNEISYSAAVTEIEEVLQQLESGELDVDQLTEKVKRVSFLIKLCKAKLKTTEEAVNRILDEELKEEDQDNKL
jgi:exodeoxyribonuclease VII small subunit